VDQWKLAGGLYVPARAKVEIVDPLESPDAAAVSSVGSQLEVKKRWKIDWVAATTLLLVLVTAYSVWISVRAFSAQTASDDAATEQRSRAAAGQVAFWPEAPAPGQTLPSIFHVENFNITPVAGWIINGFNAKIESENGLMYGYDPSWKSAYAIGLIPPCEDADVFLDSHFVDPGAGLIFVDNDSQLWFRPQGGALVRVLWTTDIGRNIQSLYNSPKYPGKESPLGVGLNCSAAR
jgi:hypothetical protein